MGLQNLPCSRCSARTGQLTLLVQLFSPRRWEGIFTVCLSCLQASQHSQRYALNEVRQTIYRARPGVGRPTLNLEDIVLRHLARVGPSKAGAVQRELGKNGIRLNDHETAELLRRMEFKGLLEKKEVSWTERVLKELLASKKAAGKPCPVCGGDKVWSLYAQLRDGMTQKESKRVVGSFCASCRSYQVDAKSLIERFVLKAKEAA